MRRKICGAFLLIAVISLGWMPMLSCKKTQETCAVCERELHSHLPVVMKENGKVRTACCMSCALTYRKQKKGVELAGVTDFQSNAHIVPEKAVYVRGSDILPCSEGKKVIRETNTALYQCYDRCEPSIIAFGKKSDALEFSREHGGTLEDFEQLQAWFANAGGHKHD